MKPFEFVLVIVSVIIGLALTEGAMGVANMIQYYETAHFYWAHIALTLFGFLFCLNYWGTVYKLHKVPRWTILQVGIMFLAGMIFFIITHITFPDMDHFDRDYEKHFHDTIGTIFVLMICFVVLYMLEGLLLRNKRRLNNYVTGIIFIALLISGSIITNTMYRDILTLVLLGIQIWFVYATKAVIYNSDEESVEGATKQNIKEKN